MTPDGCLKRASFYMRKYIRSKRMRGGWERLHFSFSLFIQTQNHTRTHELLNQLYEERILNWEKFLINNKRKENIRFSFNDKKGSYFWDWLNFFLGTTSRVFGFIEKEKKMWKKNSTKIITWWHFFCHIIISIRRSSSSRGSSSSIHMRVREWTFVFIKMPLAGCCLFICIKFLIEFQI